MSFYHCLLVVEKCLEKYLNGIVKNPSLFNQILSDKWNWIKMALSHQTWTEWEILYKGFDIMYQLKASWKRLFWKKSTWQVFPNAVSTCGVSPKGVTNLWEKTWLIENQHTYIYKINICKCLEYLFYENPCFMAFFNFYLM